jgi:GTP-binding protein
MNKLDLIPEADREKRAKAFVKKLGWKGPWYLVSGMTGEGTKELCFAIMEHVETHRRD